MCKGLATATMLLLSLCALGQEEPSPFSEKETFPPNKEVLHSTLFGAGWANVLDTYLSPYSYTGTDLRIQRETQRMTTLWNGQVSNQSLIDLNAAINKNHAHNIDEYVGGARYSQAWLYNFRGSTVVNPLERSSQRWNLAAGLAASGYLGAVYIDRSGNNPAQAKADLCVDATAMATYTMRIGHHRYLWRYQVTVPLLGLAFSPNYGQSYYEIFSLQHSDRNIVFAWPFNMPSMRHRLTLDIPISRYTLRIGYVGQFNQSTFNHLKYHSYTHDIVVGFNKYLYRK